MPELLIPHQKSCAPDAEQTPDRPPPVPFDCLGIGVCAIDHLSLVARYPQANEKTEALAYVVQAGGPVPTALATASWWGARCAYICKLGNDADGDFVLRQLARFGVDTSMVVRARRGFTPRAMIWVDQRTGQRSVVLNRPPHFGLTLQDVSRRQVLRGRILHVDGRETQVALVATRWARRAGRVVVCDLGNLRKESELLLQQVDYAVVSSTFVRQLYGECELATATRRLLRLGPRVAVVTMGEQGCWWATGEGLFHQPAFAVEVVDTTGAGDVFHGAFLYGLSRGWELARVVRWASAAAALKCRKLGGQAGIPTLAQVKRLLRQADGTPLPVRAEEAKKQRAEVPKPPR
ncbi:MAG: carbohydrate kinase family protein [Candidatus Oleimicrobiaceae bacterium]